MTTALERPAARRSPRWDEYSLLPGRTGMRCWVAVAVALVLTTAGVFADLYRADQLGIVFQACYFLGCLLAVVAVQRKGLFAPTVQPPLLLVVAVPAGVVLSGSVPSGGQAATGLAIGTPLINSFPTMAITTGVTVAIGVFRFINQRPPNPVAALQSRSEGDAERPSAPASGRVRRPPPQRADEDPEPVTEPVPRMTQQMLKRYEEHQAARRRRREQP